VCVCVCVLLVGSGVIKLPLNLQSVGRSPTKNERKKEIQKKR